MKWLRAIQVGPGRYGILTVLWLVSAYRFWVLPMSHFTMGWFAFSMWAASVNFDELLNSLSSSDNR